MATDETGRVYERTVPDGITAAVLIASWVADDGGRATTPAPVPAAVATPGPDAAPTPAPEAMRTPAPAAVPTPAPSAPGTYEAEAGTAPARGHASHTITVGAVVSHHAVGGRVELDWRRWRGLVLGAAFTGVHSSADVYSADGFSFGTATGEDATLVMQAALELRTGRYLLRGSAGAGVTLVQARARYYSELLTMKSDSVGAVTPAAELTATAGATFGSWTLRLGAYGAVMPSVDIGEVHWARGLELHGVIGVGRAW
jgi:hypothetical protein